MTDNNSDRPGVERNWDGGDSQQHSEASACSQMASYAVYTYMILGLVIQQ